MATSKQYNGDTDAATSASDACGGFSPTGQDAAPFFRMKVLWHVVPGGGEYMIWVLVNGLRKETPGSGNDNPRGLRGFRGL